jgi:hypothetical protein
VTPFEARNSPWRIALLLVVALAFVVLGAWMIGAFGRAPDHRFKTQAIGWVSVVFFGLAAILVTRRLFDTDVEIRIDANGIYWRRRSSQVIPWSAIDRITIGEVRGQRFACLFLRDPRAFPSDGVTGMLGGANKALGFGDVALGATGTDRSFDQLMSAIKQFAPGLVRSSLP